jgi:Fe-S cluster biogenesis protein NfuA
MQSRADVLGCAIVSSPRDALLQVVRDLLAPLIRADGGEVYVVHCDDDGIALHLAGRYAGCPGNTLARRRVLEPVLRAAAPNVEVVITSGVLVPGSAERID